jgi:hypothetical protein
LPSPPRIASTPAPPIHPIVAGAAINGIGPVESFDQVRTAFPKDEVERVSADQVIGLVGSVDERHGNLLRSIRPRHSGRTQCSTTTFGRGRRSVDLPACSGTPTGMRKTSHRWSMTFARAA